MRVDASMSAPALSILAMAGGDFADDRFCFRSLWFSLLKHLFPTPDPCKAGVSFRSDVYRCLTFCRHAIAVKGPGLNSVAISTTRFPYLRFLPCVSLCSYCLLAPVDWICSHIVVLCLYSLAGLSSNRLERPGLRYAADYAR